MAGLALVTDLQTLMKKVFPDGSDEQAEAQLVIDCVSAWARVQSGQQWPDAPTGVPDDVRAVVLMASRRELKNPERVITRQMGPFNVTYSPPPDGFFTPAEIAILGRFRRSGGLRVVGTTRGEHGRPWAGYLPPDYYEHPWLFGASPSGVEYYGAAGANNGFLEYDGELFPAFAEGDVGYRESIRRPE